MSAAGQRLARHGAVPADRGGQRARSRPGVRVAGNVPRRHVGDAREGTPQHRVVAGAQAPLRQLGQLKEQDVPTLEELARVAPHCVLVGVEVRGVQNHQAVGALRVRGSEGPGDHAAPVVSDDMACGEAERVLQVGDVGGERGDVVGAAFAGEVIAALVGRDHAVAGRREGRNLQAPRVPELREAVQQDHWRAVRGPGLRVVHAQAGQSDKVIGEIKRVSIHVWYFTGHSTFSPLTTLLCSL